MRVGLGCGLGHTTPRMGRAVTAGMGTEQNIAEDMLGQPIAYNMADAMADAMAYSMGGWHIAWRLWISWPGVAEGTVGSVGSLLLQRELHRSAPQLP